MERRVILKRQIINATAEYQSELNDLLKEVKQEKITKFFELPELIEVYIHFSNSVDFIFIIFFILESHQIAISYSRFLYSQHICGTYSPQIRRF